MKNIYLDNNATTPPDPEVLAEMETCQAEVFGNPSSIHAFGQKARRTIETARNRVARLIGARPDEVYFTSGGTEADNLAIFGTMARSGKERGPIITTAIEHQAVLNPCRHLETKGHPITCLTVNRNGVLEPDEFCSALSDNTALASVMLANNDTGVIQPVAALSAAAHAHGTFFHTDAVQAAGKIRVNVEKLGVDLLSLSAHKLYGPKGIGSLYVRQGVQLSSLFFGGHQEHGLRPGTENVAAIAGFGKACERAHLRLEQDTAQMEELRRQFETSVLREIPGTTVYGAEAPRLPNTSFIGFSGLDGELLVISLDLLGIAASTGAACATAYKAPSHVLSAMGIPAREARSAVRFSIGRTTTAEEIEQAATLVQQAVTDMRGGIHFDR